MLFNAEQVSRLEMCEQMDQAQFGASPLGVGYRRAYGHLGRGAGSEESAQSLLSGPTLPRGAWARLICADGLFLFLCVR